MPTTRHLPAPWSVDERARDCPARVTIGKVCAEPLQITQDITSEGGAMHSFHNSSFDPQTLMLLETAFDEAWLTLKLLGNKTVKPDELARSVLRVARER